MAFSDEVLAQAWKRANGTCECARHNHGHFAKCHKDLLRWKRGQEGWGGWQARHINDPNDDSLSNCEILCWECLELIGD
ncbi:MAG: hypothetical protein PVJ61_04065 [Dehalococcoidia bacterium]|jgi:hypothetical protein